ncbi:MAG: hypothetical protein LBI95_04305 [Holosporales bacterium]|jgi:hypothetical protein|nr:hypothetical protein [Holosporales bacterium]
MAESRHYISGADGSIPGIGGCPFDMDRLQRDYVSGGLTPTKIINFGGKEGGLETDISMELTPLDACTGEQILDVLGCSGFYETSTLNFRISNLHKPGSARASDVWVAIPDNIVVPKLVQKLHQGAIDKIRISSLAYLDKGAKDQPRIVQSAEYTTCFVKFVDPLSYGLLSVFSFSFVKVKITQVDIKQISESGTNGESGRYVYEFDYNQASGGTGA